MNRRLHALAMKMPTETSYQLVIRYASQGGKADPESLERLSLRMPTEESYQRTKSFAEALK